MYPLEIQIDWLGKVTTLTFHTRTEVPMFSVARLRSTVRARQRRAAWCADTHLPLRLRDRQQIN